jgi:hypothetical protein
MLFREAVLLYGKKYRNNSAGKNHIFNIKADSA